MEKVKRKSKYIIAIIIATLLLISSFVCLGTGAYFTAADSKTITSGVIQFGLVACEMTANGLQVKRNGGNWENATNNMIVMPGDKFKGGNFTITITTTDKSGVYYLIKDNSGNYKTYDSTSKQLVDAPATLTPVAVPATAGATGTLSFTFGGPTQEEYIGGKSADLITNDVQNNVLTLGLSGTYSVKVIQASNTTQANALSYLKSA